MTAAAAFGLGVLLGRVAPSWGTSGWQLLEWGFVIPTVALYLSTFAVNSLAHRFGSRRFATRDASRNNRLVSFLTLGEGWHNNHHRFPNSARQGLTASEPDPAWWAIVVLARLGLARAYALEAQSDAAYREKARTAYQNFLTLWKDADPDIPIYKQAKAEYAKLQ